MLILVVVAVENMGGDGYYNDTTGSYTIGQIDVVVVPHKLQVV